MNGWLSVTCRSMSSTSRSLNSARWLPRVPRCGAWPPPIRLAAACFLPPWANVGTRSRLPTRCQTALHSQKRDRLGFQQPTIWPMPGDNFGRSSVVLPTWLPLPTRIFRQAAATGLRTWLLDTYEKVPGNDSLSRLGPQTLRSIASLAEHSSATWVLAGSISPAIAQSLTDLGIRPSLLGVRGSLCDGDRRNEIIPAKVEAWIDWLRADCTAQAAYPDQVDLSEPIAEVPARLPSS